MMTPGNRLRIAREMTNMTRTNFCKKHHLKLNSMNAWENDTARFSQDMAMHLSTIFKKHNVLIDPDWLTQGIGPEPVMEKAPSFDPTDPNFLLPDEDDEIWAEASRLKKYYKKCLIYIVHDDSCLPFFKPGDFLAGVPTESPIGLEGTTCILELEGGVKIVRKITTLTENKNRYKVACLNPNSQLTNKTVDTLDVIAAAPIIWFRRKANQARELR